MERLNLAPYAAKSIESLGRRHPEVFKDDRPAFQRDRDRIIHCAAFRRLEYKTQVFVNHEGDYYRTRLTHSLEVAQIARGIATRLKLNEDLVEALSLSHDLGHTPFGHTGEEVLNRLMAGCGGFDHNRQSLRIVEELEERYPGFNGLNLTWETREGIIKHSPRYENSELLLEDEYFRGKRPTLEAQIIDLADEIAYNNHDIDDGLKAGYISIDELYEVDLWREIFDMVSQKFPELEISRRIYQTISYLIGALIEDVVHTSEKLIREAGVRNLLEVRNEPRRLISFSPEVEKKNKALKTFLFKRLYRHYKVERMRIKAELFLTRIFESYLATPSLLPDDFQAKMAETRAERVICDYIAGMTDRYAMDQYRRLFEPFERV
ncbi:MAG: deoxyguanosinetriphosphate triphosphohydrolase [Deltaproteobacteria bacterium]|nr:deoxyguanosinetriphosphate triphosphohydrolase [Deltaproteobacteria bacterium]